MWNWNLTIPNIPGSSLSREVSYKALSTSIPGSKLEQVGLEAHGIKLNFAGRRQWDGTWNVTLVETRDSSTRDAFLAWQELARSWKANAGSYKSIYSTTVSLELYDDLPQVVREIKLFGVFPTSIDDVQLDQTGDIVRYSIQFSFDYSEG
jgi:hypothetical protein